MPHTSPFSDRNFFKQATQDVARQLLGMKLVSRVGNRKTSGVIVETEAYLAKNDPACHGTRGLTKSNASMFGKAGVAYVYPIHARYCFNIVTGKQDEPTAVLIRAVQPASGIDTMRSRRGNKTGRELTAGPARLCEAMGINRKSDGLDLLSGMRIWLEGEPGLIAASQVMVTPRIGVTSAQKRKLRFLIANQQFVSGPKYLRTR